MSGECGSVVMVLTLVLNFSKLQGNKNVLFYFELLKLIIPCLLNFITMKEKIGHSEYIDIFLGLFQGRLGYTVVNSEYLYMM